MKKLLVFIVVLALAFSALAGSTTPTSGTTTKTAPPPVMNSWSGWGG